MKHLSILCLAALALGGSRAAAQENKTVETRTVTLFEGQPIERLRVSGDIDVEVRQGMPNSLVLEIPVGVSVDSTASNNRETYTYKDMARGLKASEDEQNRVYCSLQGGGLYLSNGYLKTDERNGGGRAMRTVSNFKARAVITVGDLKSVSFYSKGRFRMADDVKLRATGFDFFNRTDLSGLHLTATESLSIKIFNYSRFEARIFDTPTVAVSAFNNATVDLMLDGVKTLSAKAFNSGSLRLRGQVEQLAESHFNHGKIDFDSLQADRVVRQQEQEAKTVIGIGSTLGIGRETRVATAAEKGMTLRKLKPGDEALPEATTVGQTFTLPLDSSLVLHGGRYRIDRAPDGIDGIQLRRIE